MIDEARTSGAKVHFASLMDICHLKNAELEAKHQKYEGRGAFRCDIVKDDFGSYAVFTSRLPGCDGQAADAVSAHTQVNMEVPLKLLKIPKPECPDIWIRLLRHKRLNHGPVSKAQSFLSSEICTVTFWQDLWERQFENILLKHGWENVPNWECLFVHRQKGVILICVCG